MKNLTQYIIEKLHPSKYKESIEEWKPYIDLGEFLLATSRTAISKKFLKNVIQGKEKIDKEFYIKMYDDLIYVIKKNNKWVYGVNINNKIINLLDDIKQDKAKENDINQLNYNIILGFKKLLKTFGNLDEYINESFEDNLFWKIDKYFENHDDEKKIFIDIIDYFRDHPGFNKKTVEDYIQDKEFKNMKKFLDFLDDIVKQEDTNKDYTYILYLVIKKIISDKVEGEKYTNKK